MAVAHTKAAEVLQAESEGISSHKVISLLMAGALERVSQAKQCLNEGNEQDKEVILAKIIAIINGLRSSLNVNEGGEIAVNLDNLYDYMLTRLAEANGKNEEVALTEVGKLIKEIKVGWDAIEAERESA